MDVCPDEERAPRRGEGDGGNCDSREELCTCKQLVSAAGRCSWQTRPAGPGLDR